MMSEGDDIGATRTVGKTTRRQLLLGLAASFAASHITQYAAEELEASHFRSVQTAADDVITAIEGRLKTLPEDKTLFVPMGENHATPSHRLVMQGVMQGLKERGHSIAFGFEGDYDLLAEAKIPFSEQEEKAKILSQDPDGENVLRMVSSMDALYQDAFASLQNLARFCLEENISTSFNDLSKISGLWLGNPLDPTDPETIFFTLFFGQEPFTPIQATEPLGMGMRNASMMLKSIKHAAAENARVYIQHCGGIHVFGEALFESPFGLSLTNAYTMANEAVLPVVLCRKGLVFEDQALEYMASHPAVLFDDLNDKTFSYDWLTGQDAEVRAAELAHMRVLVRRTGLRLYDGGDPRFQETVAMKTLPQRELTANLRKHLEAMGIKVESLDLGAP